MSLIVSSRSEQCLVDLPPDPVLARQDLVIRNDHMHSFRGYYDSDAQVFSFLFCLQTLVSFRFGQIVLVLLFAAVLIVNLLFSKKINENTISAEDKIPRPVNEEKKISFDEDVRIEYVAFPENRTRECEVEPWNNVSTVSYSFEDVRTKWRELHVGRWVRIRLSFGLSSANFQGNLRDGKLWPVGAFVYKEEIVVTTATQNRYGWAASVGLTTDTELVQRTRLLPVLWL